MKLKVYKKQNGCLLWNCVVADSPLKRAIGIMGKKKFEPLLFTFPYKHELPISIHSFFCPVFYAIFLDKWKKVVQIRKFSSAEMFTSLPAAYLIEVNEKKGVKVGDALIW